MKSLGIDIGGSSIKIAWRRDGQTAFTRRSDAYVKPSLAELMAILRSTVGNEAMGVDAVGLCAPGMLNRAARCVAHSVNLPCLNDQPLDRLLSAANLPTLPRAALLTDTGSAALDIYASRSLSGRLFLLALGTGIGAAVRDETGPLHVDGESPGHFGQLDVSLPGVRVIGPDGGAGGLEGYLGATALQQQYGRHYFAMLPNLPVTAPPLAALVRAVRIGHAIYCPHHVCPVGGIGNILVSRVTELREGINADLTRIARPDWTLTCGNSDFHAALGAARMSESAA